MFCISLNYTVDFEYGFTTNASVHLDEHLEYSVDGLGYVRLHIKIVYFYCGYSR
jgi:hypothetical protein